MGMLSLRLFIVLTLALLTPGYADRPARAAASPDVLVQCTLARMDLRDRVGQIMMVSIDGTRTTRHMQNLLRAWRAGGIVLFSRNVGTARDLRGLIAGMQRAARPPLLVATDQEGGLVARIRVGLTPLPSPAYYGRLGSSDRLFADTQSQGLALRRLGINLNLAPVVDVRDTPDSAIGDRSFGPDPVLDAALVRAAIRGYQSAGIGATAKHFLGLGEVRENADLTLPVVNVSRATLEARDMVPMRAAIAVRPPTPPRRWSRGSSAVSWASKGRLSPTACSPRRSSPGPAPPRRRSPPCGPVTTSCSWAPAPRWGSR
jgi:hypothetical protein